MSGYTNSKENAEIKAWDYTNGVLNIEWKQPEISFGNPLITKEAESYVPAEFIIEELFNN